jgi:hypothetical protein
MGEDYKAMSAASSGMHYISALFYKIWVKDCSGNVIMPSYGFAMQKVFDRVKV